HRERRIPIRRGRNRHEVKQVYIRFCFPDAATAHGFRKRFGGECLTHAPGKPKPRTSATASHAPAVKREGGMRGPRRLERTSLSALIRGHLTAKASSSTSPASRITKLRSPPTTPPVNVGPAPPLPCGRARV